MSGEEQISYIVAFIAAGFIAWKFVVEPLSTKEKRKAAISSFFISPVAGLYTALIVSSMIGFFVGIAFQLPMIFGYSFALMIVLVIGGWCASKLNRAARRNRRLDQ